MFPLNSNKIFLTAMGATSCIAGILVLLIVFFIGYESLPAIDIGIEKFFLDAIWDPSTGQYNLMPMALGSLLVTVGSIIIALPISFLMAVVCEYTFPKKLGFGLRSLVEILAGIPSVIFGFWGIVAIIPLLYYLSPPGANILAGCIVLATMILPTLTIFIMNSIRSAPKQWFIAGRSLGLSESTIVFKIIVPGIKDQLGIGILIAMGRAIGETMAVLMVCGNIIKVPLSIFDPIRTLTSNIALEMAYAMNNHRAALFVSGLFLLILVSFLTLITHWQQNRSFQHADI